MQYTCQRLEELSSLMHLSFLSYPNHLMRVLEHYLRQAQRHSLTSSPSEKMSSSFQFLMTLYWYINLCLNAKIKEVELGCVLKCSNKQLCYGHTKTTTAISSYKLLNKTAVIMKYTNWQIKIQECTLKYSAHYFILSMCSASLLVPWFISVLWI